MKHTQFALLLLAMTALFGGCGKAAEQDPTAKTNPNEKLFPASLFVTEAPAGEMAVAKIKSEKLAAGKEVVVTGTIGGRKVPLSGKFATMAIVCETLPVPKEACGCADAGWVFSCTAKDKLMPHQASVQILDAAKAPIKASLEGIQGLTGGRVVSVKGIIVSNEGGGLVLSATEVYVHPVGGEPHVHGEGCDHDDEEEGHEEGDDHDEEK